MLSGRVPFQGSLKETTVAQQIKGGNLSFAGEEWQGVSQPARELIKGTFLDIRVELLF